jgi:GTP-binding protein Era
MNSPTHRAGHVAVIGRPNVGKSTLVNALVGAKVSIVSPRPQTTRHRLLGIATFPEGQLLLVDTPGIHREQKRAMNRLMNRAARGALEGVDVALLVVRAGQWDDEDTLAYDALKDAGLPVILVVNQVDRITDKTKLLPYLAKVSQDRDFAGVHPVSALKRSGLEALTKTVLSQLPEQPPLYAEDEITDKSQRFLAGELVREQLMRQLGEELPYATTVEIERFVEDPSPKGRTVAHRCGDLGRTRRPEADRDRQGRRTPARDRHQVAPADGAPVRLQGLPRDLGARARRVVGR